MKTEVSAAYMTGHEAAAIWVTVTRAADALAEAGRRDLIKDMVLAVSAWQNLASQLPAVPSVLHRLQELRELLFWVHDLNPVIDFHELHKELLAWRALGMGTPATPLALGYATEAEPGESLPAWMQRTGRDEIFDYPRSNSKVAK